MTYHSIALYCKACKLVTSCILCNLRKFLDFFESFERRLHCLCTTVIKPWNCTFKKCVNWEYWEYFAMENQSVYFFCRCKSTPSYVKDTRRKKKGQNEKEWLPEVRLIIFFYKVQRHWRIRREDLKGDIDRYIYIYTSEEKTRTMAAVIKRTALTRVQSSPLCLALATTHTGYQVTWHGSITTIKSHPSTSPELRTLHCQPLRKNLLYLF